MTTERTQRVRDPVHGLITFRADNPIDQLAWCLLDTPEFQRLRRIKQLGVSEFVFPSATHSRFAHCIGVFHTARRLTAIIERELGASEYEPLKAEVAVVAALLHDLGHGPFSHTFESVQRSRGVKKRHEEWTAEIVRNPDGNIKPLLDTYREGFCEEIARLLEAEDPADIYHAIVSSSFDADRLDYLLRDRLMTGTKAGAIDFDWLMEHVRVRNIQIEAAEAESESEDGWAMIPTFCLDAKALPAAEQFLLARYTLHEQVYFHKTTRCIEHMIGKLLRRVSVLVSGSLKSIKNTGLDKEHPLVRFFGSAGATVENYLALDDVVVMGAIESMTRAPDETVKELADRIRTRRLYKTLDLRAFGHDEGRQRKAARRIDQRFADQITKEAVLKDDRAAVSIYTQIGGDDDKAHKRLHITDLRGPVEITQLPRTVVRGLGDKTRFTRYYFENESDRDEARGKEGS